MEAGWPLKAVSVLPGSLSASPLGFTQGWSSPSTSFPWELLMVRKAQAPGQKSVSHWENQAATRSESSCRPRLLSLGIFPWPPESLARGLCLPCGGRWPHQKNGATPEKRPVLTAPSLYPPPSPLPPSRSASRCRLLPSPGITGAEWTMRVWRA